jgi:DNA adenine methylase
MIRSFDQGAMRYNSLPIAGRTRCFAAQLERMSRVKSTSDDERRLAKRDGTFSPSNQPFLKWPGGKRWLVPELIKIIKEYNYVTYREPFLGGGALFFALRPKQSVLSDINTDLINTYSQVKMKANALLEQLRPLPISESTYYELRESCPTSPLQRAVRFLYLNRTAFGGMYRLNQKGKFNVPFGGGERTTAPLWKCDLLTSSARSLRGAKLLAIDFEQALAKARKGDVVYCDPTYTVAHNNNGFIRYNERNFSWADQERLSLSCRLAADRGALVIVSNAHHAEVLELFSPPRYIAVERTSCLCPEVKHRRSVCEYIFVFPPTGCLQSVASR